MEEPQFIDAEQVYNKEVSSMKDLIMRHLSKISEICSKEFRGGYFNETFSGNQIIRTYIPDTRDSYINAVNFLYDLLLPRFDEEMTKQDEKITTELNEGYEKEKKNNPKYPKSELYLPFKRKMFQQLSLLIHRIKLFESLGIAE